MVLPFMFILNFSECRAISINFVQNIRDNYGTLNTMVPKKDI